MISIPSSQITQYNSSTYVDMLGVLVGLARIPGENSAAFAQRVNLAISCDRGADYVGLMNALNLQLNLQMTQAARISSALSFTAAVSFGALDLANSQETLHIPLLSLTSDNFWQWQMISDVLLAIGESKTFTVDQVGPDAPALQLVLQKNTSLVLGEAVASDMVVRLAHGSLVRGSELFNQPVPAYTYSADGQTLYFGVPVPAGTTIGYRYQTCPYSLVASPAAVFSLTDPNVGAWTVGPNGTMIYQAQEYVQEILQRDGSYWGQ